LANQELEEVAKERGAVNEIAPADKSLARDREIAEALSQVATAHHEVHMRTQKLRRIVDEGVAMD